VTGYSHAIGDIVGFDLALAEDPKALEADLLAAARAAGLTPAAPALVRKFEPQGATAVLLLMESHLTVHTYPERGVAKADAFTCRPGSGEKALAALAHALGGRAVNVRAMER
jgi:S-adenosylmethionine decarboxylase proenzyme